MSDNIRCSTCGGPFVSFDGEQTTTVGMFDGQPGHNHDDNCVTRAYWCVVMHMTVVSVRRSCSDPNCVWRGKKTRFCHPGEKVDEWPAVHAGTEDGSRN